MNILCCFWIFIKKCIERVGHIRAYVAFAGLVVVATATMPLAWLWLRHQSGSDLSRWFHQRVGDRRGKIRRITIVALARKLLVALWRYVTQYQVVGTPRLLSLFDKHGIKVTAFSWTTLSAECPRNSNGAAKCRIAAP